MTMQDWDSEQAALRSEALLLLDNSPLSQAICSVIVESLQELVKLSSESSLSSFVQEKAIKTIALRLREHEFSEWSDAIEARSTTPHPTVEPKLVAVEILVGRSSGCLCGKSPGDLQFAFVRHLRNIIPFLSKDFFSTAEDALSSAPGAKDALEQMLRQRSALCVTEPARVAHIMPRHLHQLSEEQSSPLRFVDVWDEPFRRHLILLHDADAFDLLRRCDRHAYLDILERFPFREGIHELINIADSYATSSDLCLLLKDARPAFDENGEWIKENKLAFLVLNILSDRLLRLVSDEGGSTSEFRNALDEILEAMVSRTDINSLGYAWFQRLLTSGRSIRRRRPEAQNRREVGASLLVIAKDLADRVLPHPNPEKWISTEEYVWRNNRIYTLLAIDLHRHPSNPSHFANFIKRLALDEMVSTVGIERLLDNAGCLEWLAISGAIAEIPDLNSWFNDLWAQLFWLRDRARSHRHMDVDYPNIGKVVIVWMVCGLNRLPPGSAGARELWLTLESAIRESCLTEFFRQHDDVWSKSLRMLGGLWQRNFPEDPASGTAGSLEDFIAPWLQVDVNLALLAVILNRYDASPKQLRRAGITSDLLRMIVDDAKALGRSLLDDETISVIKTLASNLERID